MEGAHGGGNQEKDTLWIFSLLQSPQIKKAQGNEFMRIRVYELESRDRWDYTLRDRMGAQRGTCGLLDGDLDGARGGVGGGGDGVHREPDRPLGARVLDIHGADQLLRAADLGAAGHHLGAHCWARGFVGHTAGHGWFRGNGSGRWNVEAGDLCGVAISDRSDCGMGVDSYVLEKWEEKNY